jgi:hypothetical protein
MEFPRTAELSRPPLIVPRACQNCAQAKAKCVNGQEFEGKCQRYSNFYVSRSQIYDIQMPPLEEALRAKSSSKQTSTTKTESCRNRVRSLFFRGTNEKINVPQQSCFEKPGFKTGGEA